MLLGDTPFGILPLASLDPADLTVVAGALETRLADQDNALLFLLETTPGTEGDPTGTMLRLSDFGFATDGTETPAYTRWPGRLAAPLNYESRIPMPDDEVATGSIGFGVVEMRNEDGALNSLLAKSIEGRQVDIKVGGTLHEGRADEYTLKYAEFGLALRATADGLTSEKGRILLRLREGLAKLERQLQTTRYAGAGLSEGPAELTGVVKPLTFGEVYNRSAVLVDPTYLIYQVHERSVEAIDEVRIRGNSVGTYDGDVGSYLALLFATVAAGHWVSCRTLGMFRLGGLPDGDVTADVRGDNVGGYVDTTSEVAKRVATWKGELVDPSDLDGSTFASFTAPGTMGYAADAEITVGDALEEILRSARGWLRVTRAARLAIGRFVAPEDQTAVATYTDVVLSDEADDSELPPVWRVKVGYKRIWQVQDADALYDLATAADRLLYSTEYRYAIAEDSAVKTLHRDAREIEHPTLYVDQADAQDVADETLAMLSVRRRVYRFRRERSVLERVPGETIEIQSDESDLSGGRNVWLASVAEVGHEAAIDCEAWG